MTQQQILAVTLCAVLAAGCQKNPDEPLSDMWPTLHDAALPDHSPPDLTPDCPTLSGDAAAISGWRVAWNAVVPLHDVACVNDHVYVAGSLGTLLHRPPLSPQCGGFVKQTVPTQADLLSVSFADLAYGVTAGRDPTIWETKDGGKTWTVAPQCGDVKFKAFHGLHLYSNLKGFGAGEAEQGGAYKIFPGKTWICPNQTFANQVFHDTFRLGDKAWLVGDTGGRIYHTPDEGMAWFFTDTAFTKPLHGVSFTSKGVGVAVGEESIVLRTEDDVGWSQVTMLGTDDLYDVYFFDDDNGWIVGDNGSILHSADAGKTWSYQIAATTDSIQAVCFTSSKEGWAVTDKGTVLYTTTGGE